MSAATPLLAGEPVSVQHSRSRAKRIACAALALAGIAIVARSTSLLRAGASASSRAVGSAARDDGLPVLAFTAGAIALVQLDANASIQALMGNGSESPRRWVPSNATFEPTNNTAAAKANGPALKWAAAQCGQYSGMPLACTVTVGVNRARLGSEAVDATVAYRASGEDKWLFTAPQRVSGNATHEIFTVVRLRPDTVYEARVVTAYRSGPPTVLARGSFTSASTGITEFDDGPICNVTGRTPTFGILYFDVQMGDFQGVVAIDHAGYVVWYYQVLISGENVAVMAFDKFPDHRFLVQAVGMEPWGFSELMVVDAPTAEILASRVTGCSGDPINYTQFSHEARVRPAHGDVITVKEYVKKISDIDASHGEKEYNLQGLGAVEYVFNDIIGAWKPDVDDDGDDDGDDGSFVEMYHMLQYFDPFSDDVSAVNSYTLTEAMCGSDDGKLSVLDWSHVSAISFADRQGYYIISLRNIDTVAAIDAVTGTLKWRLSSHDNVGSDFRWNADEDKFYNVHSAYIVEETDFVDDFGTNTSGKLRLMLFDGGNNRPGCHLNNTGCFSRACEYHLDTMSGAVTLAWQFAYPYGEAAGQRSQKRTDAFVSDGGSAVLFANDANDEKMYFAAFTTSSNVGNEGAHAFVFMVDGHGAIQTEISVRQHYWNAVAAGMYRALPSKSIYGEGEDFPFTTTHQSSLN